MIPARTPSPFAGDAPHGLISRWPRQLDTPGKAETPDVMGAPSRTPLCPALGQAISGPTPMRVFTNPGPRP
jgi:hypothetical protein